ncbi:MAG: 16S rRNA (guanine(527)-N(7))-methyltransferase RsmG [Chitinophagaceae bacterium]
MELILKYFGEFTPEQIGRFEALKDLYHEWNSRINVISRKDIDGLYEKHVLHSLAIATMTELPPGSEVIDIGTGGGFPGIPLAIFYPEVSFHLVDSIRKKLTVVEAVAEAIGLDNVTIQHCRAEEIHNRKFDYAVSRAVAPLRDLWTWSRPLLRKRPMRAKEEGDYLQQGLICLKGGDLKQEISESGTRPGIIKIEEIFSEEWFREKYMIHCRY